MNEPSIILRTILTFSFVLAAGFKIVGANFMKRLFNDFKLNRLAMVLFGIIELLLVVGLYLPNLAFYSSIGLAYITSTALYKHVKVGHPLIKFIPALLLLILSMINVILMLKPV